jgi:hypothetical protein
MGRVVLGRTPEEDGTTGSPAFSPGEKADRETGRTETVPSRSVAQRRIGDDRLRGGILQREGVTLGRVAGTALGQQVVDLPGTMSAGVVETRPETPVRAGRVTERVGTSNKLALVGLGTGASSPTPGIRAGRSTLPCKEEMPGARTGDETGGKTTRLVGAARRQTAHTAEARAEHQVTRHYRR